MTHNYLPRLLFVPAIAAILAFTSCQREVDFIDINNLPDNVKDSTLLIKNITFIGDDGFGVMDTVIES